MLSLVVEDSRSEKSTHARWIRCRRGGMEASLPVPPNHQGFVDVPTAVWQWSDIIAGSIKARPSTKSEIKDALNVAQQPRRLLAIHTGKLALVPGHRPKFTWCQRPAQFRELPDTGRFASVGHAQILWVLQQ